MSIGGKMRLDDIDRTAFSRMAEGIGISPAIVLRRLDAMSAKIVSAAEALASEYSATCPSPMFGAITSFIANQVARLATQ